MQIEFPYLVEDVDRHGNVRIYFRRPGQRKVRLRSTPGTPAFHDEYCAAATGVARPLPVKPAPPPAGSLRSLCQIYFTASAEYKGLGDRTRKLRRRWLEHICSQPNGDGRPRGDDAAAGIKARHIRAMRDKRADRPGAADNLLRALRHFFKWAVVNEHLDYNPARDVPYFRPATEGWHTWTIEEFRQFEARHPIGTRPRLALALLAFTGVRRSDVVRLGRQMVHDGWLAFREAKGASRSVKLIEIPILPQLQEVLDATPNDDLTFLVTRQGAPFTVAGFGGWFRERCDQAGLPHCTAHGLRKMGATIAAENGATENQLMAIYGWVTSEQPTRYTRKANRRRMAGSAMHLIAPPPAQAPAQKPNDSVPLSGGVRPVGQKQGAK